MERTYYVSRGLLVGAVFAVSAMVSYARWVLANRASSAPMSTSDQHLFLGVTVTILGIGLLGGVVAALREQTRRLGLGMLLGLVITFPVAWLLTFALMWEGN